MYVFYFPQIIGNLNGHKGDWIQPLVAAINCTLWMLYGLWRPRRTFQLSSLMPRYCFWWSCSCDSIGLTRIKATYVVVNTHQMRFFSIGILLSVLFDEKSRIFNVPSSHFLV